MKEDLKMKRWKEIFNFWNSKKCQKHSATECDSSSYKHSNYSFQRTLHVWKHLIIIFLILVDLSIPTLWVISTFLQLSPLFAFPCMLSIATAFMYLFNPNRPHGVIKTVLRISFLLWAILAMGFVMWYIADLLCLHWDFASYAVRWNIGNWPLHFGPFETLYRLLKTS